MKFEWCKHIRTSKTAYKSIWQLTEHSIQLQNFHEDQITKENWISVAQAKVIENDNWNELGIMALCRSIVGSYADPLWAAQSFVTEFFFLSTGRRPPGWRLFNSNHEIFQWMLARYRFSNSRCALSDSCHLHLLPHVRFFTRDWFFPVYIFQMQLHEMCALMQHALLSAS